MRRGAQRLRPGVRRALRHLGLAAACALAGAGVASLVDAPDPLFQASMATAYVGLALLAVTLLLGPWNVLRARPNPVSTHLRRDVGIWAAGVAFLHVAVGIQRHFTGHPLSWFRYPDARRGVLGPLRDDLFGLQSWTGLAATVLLLLLLVLSNDLSLRRLGSRRWKRWQLWNYAILPLVVLHGVVFQMIEKRGLPWRGGIVATTLGVMILQLFGVLRRRRDRRGADG